MSSSLEGVRATLGAAMDGAEPGRATADLLCSTCVNLLGVDGAAISMVHDGVSQGTFGASGAASRRLDEYQFTFGEGPCLDAASSRRPVLVPYLDAPQEQRWPGFTGAALDEGVRAVFALPIMMSSACVGALDLFRESPGPLTAEHLAGGLLAAELASRPLLDLVASASGDSQDASAGDGDGLADMDRLEIYQATGMLISQLEVDADEAMLRLRAHAIGTGQTASEVAWAIVERRLVLERDHLGGADGRTYP